MYVCVISRKRFVKFIFRCKVQLFRLETEYYFIRMAAAADLIVSHSIEPIFVNVGVLSRQWHVIANIVLQTFSYHWFVGITLFFNGAAQKIV